MAEKEKRIQAEVAFVGDGKGNGSRARVPSTVRDWLGAGPSDKLIFEGGCETARALAALRGRYVIVSLERAKAPAVDQERPSETGLAVELEPLDEAVRKKLQGEDR
ncbi:MAG TPA: hypothetical protein VF723_11355 [Pyrinomonadaceae bacterium]|jgi:hypothetical protein